MKSCVQVLPFKARVISRQFHLKNQGNGRALSRRSRVCVRAGSKDGGDKFTDADRRSILMAGVLGVGVCIQRAAEAAAPPVVQKEKAEPLDYYSELLSAKEGKQPRINLDSYEQLKKEKIVKKGSTLKPNLRSKTSKSSTALRGTNAASSDAGASFNAFGISLGLAAIASVGFLGSKTKDRASKTSTIQRKGVQSKASSPSRSIRSSGTMSLKQGTKKLSRPKTNVAGPKTKQVGTKIKSKIEKPKMTTKKSMKKASLSKKEKDDTNVGTIAGLGLTGFALAALLFFGTSSNKDIENSTTLPVVVEGDAKIVEVSKRKSSEDITVSAPAMIKEMPADEKRQETSKFESSSPSAPTVDNRSPIESDNSTNANTSIAIGAAVLFGIVLLFRENPSSDISTEPNKTSESQAIEARKWIENWKSKQQPTSEKSPEERAAEAKIWIERWKAKQQK